MPGDFFKSVTKEWNFLMRHFKFNFPWLRVVTKKAIVEKQQLSNDIIKATENCKQTRIPPLQTVFNLVNNKDYRSLEKALEQGYPTQGQLTPRSLNHNSQAIDETQCPLLISLALLDIKSSRILLLHGLAPDYEIYLSNSQCRVNLINLTLNRLSKQELYSNQYQDILNILIMLYEFGANFWIKGFGALGEKEQVDVLTYLKEKINYKLLDIEDSVRDFVMHPRSLKSQCRLVLKNNGYVVEPSVNSLPPLIKSYLLFQDFSF